MLGPGDVTIDKKLSCHHGAYILVGGVRKTQHMQTTRDIIIQYDELHEEITQGCDRE